MKEKIGTIVAIILLGGLCVAALAVGIIRVKKMGDAEKPSSGYNLSDNKGEWVTGNLLGASEEVYEIKHTMSYVIPTGKEHFFFAILDDGTLVTIRAAKKWHEKNFNDDGTAKNEKGLEITGFVRTIDSKFVNDIQRQANTLGVGLFKPTVYIDLLGFRYAVFLIIIGGVPILAGIVVLILKKIGVLDQSLDSRAAKIGGVVAVFLFLGYAAIMLHTFAML